MFGRYIGLEQVLFILEQVVKKIGTIAGPYFLIDIHLRLITTYLLNNFPTVSTAT